MKIFIGVKKLVLSAAVSALSAGAMAANQGDTGSTSTGDFDITYNKGAEVRIWGLQDVSFDGDVQDVSTEDLTDSFTFCTFSNNTNEVVFDVASQNTNFTLAGPGGEELPYYIELADQGAAVKDRWGSPTGQMSGAQSYSSYITQQDNDGAGGALCAAGQQTTDLTITIPQQDFVPANGAYTDNVTITVKPV